MATLKFTVAFDGIEIDDFELLDQFVELLPDVHWGEVDGEVQADVYTDGSSFEDAAQQVVAMVRKVAPQARATRLVEDLVATPDIAKRTGVSRETVRLWSKEASFPRARSVVGNGIRIWDWAAVNTWLRNEHVGRLGDPYRHPTPFDVAQVNALLRQRESHWSLLESERKVRPTSNPPRWQEVRMGVFSPTFLAIIDKSAPETLAREAVAG